MHISSKTISGWLVASVLFGAIMSYDKVDTNEQSLAQLLSTEAANQAASDLLAEDSIRLKYAVQNFVGSDAISYAAVLDSENTVIVKAGQRGAEDTHYQQPIIIDRAIAGYVEMSIVATDNSLHQLWYLLPLLVLVITHLLDSRQVVIQGARAVKGTTYQLRLQIDSSLEGDITKTQVMSKVDKIFELVTKLYPLKAEGHGLTFSNTPEDIYQTLCCAAVVRQALALSLNTDNINKIRVTLAPAANKATSAHPISCSGFRPRLETNASWQLVEIAGASVATLADEQLEGLLLRQAEMIAKQVA